MTKTEYREYIGSEDWQKRRKEFLAECGEVCEHCGLPRWLAIATYDQDLHVHHKSYSRVGHEDWEDLAALCKRCHELETFGRSELRALVSYSCRVCQRKHWDAYSDGMCSVCADLFLRPGLLIHNLCSAKYPYEKDVPIWKSIIVDLLRWGPELNELIDYIAAWEAAGIKRC